MDNQQKIRSLMDHQEYSVPKVSIDGKSHGDLLLIAIGSAATFAVVILFILTSLIRHKKKPVDDADDCGKKERKNGDFTLTASPSDSGISTSSSQKSNLMFKYFGKSLSSFDVEQSASPAMEMRPSFAISINHSERSQFYRQNILAIIESETGRRRLDESPKSKYIQTIEC